MMLNLLELKKLPIAAGLLYTDMPLLATVDWLSYLNLIFIICYEISSVSIGYTRKGFLWDLSY